MEYHEKLHELKARITVLEWDAQHHQINPYKKQELEQLKKEYAALEQEGTVSQH